LELPSKMKQVIIALLATMALSLTATAQSNNLYVFKNERREHLKAAKLERAAAREKAVANDFFIRIRTQTSMSTAMMMIDMKKPYDAEVRITDMNGAELAMVFKGKLGEGKHEFTYEPEGDLRKPFVCQLTLDGKTEAMKVVKFNSF
jgi:hypothetical protein